MIVGAYVGPALGGASEVGLVFGPLVGSVVVFGRVVVVGVVVGSVAGAMEEVGSDFD